MAEAHFNAKFRFMKAKNKTSDRAPDYNLVMDYTVEEAKKAAAYFNEMAVSAQLAGNTVRVYTGKGEYTEEPGFSIWGSLWGAPTDASSSGKIAPLKD